MSCNNTKFILKCQRKTKIENTKQNHTRTLTLKSLWGRRRKKNDHFLSAGL